MMMAVFGLLNWTSGEALDRLIDGPSCIFSYCEHPSAAFVRVNGRVLSCCDTCWNEGSFLDPEIHEMPEEIRIRECSPEFLKTVRMGYSEVASRCTSSGDFDEHDYDDYVHDCEVMGEEPLSFWQWHDENSGCGCHLSTSSIIRMIER